MINLASETFSKHGHVDLLNGLIILPNFAIMLSVEKPFHRRAPSAAILASEESGHEVMKRGRVGTRDVLFSLA